MKRTFSIAALASLAGIVGTGCVPVRHNLPPEQRMLQPGPGVGGPGPGVIPPMPYRGAAAGPLGVGGVSGLPAGGMIDAGPAAGSTCQTTPGSAVSQVSAARPPVENGEIQQVGFGAAIAGHAQCGPDGCGVPGCGPGGNCLTGPGSNIPLGGGVIGGVAGGGVMPMRITTAQVTFGNPSGMQVRYDVGGAGLFDSEPLVVPARQNFPQGALYRFKLTNIPSRPGVELYPTLELAYANPRTGAYLAHNSVPIQFLEEDFDQVLTGNFVTKVIYLPDPDFQGPAIAGIDTLVSTRLDPGIDPIVEADRRGSILAIIRLGDKDIEMEGQFGEAMPAGGGFYGPSLGMAGMPAPIAPAMTDGCGCGSHGGPGGMPGPPQLPGFIAGYNAPQYGMPITGTPIGLAGPPHIPLGAPAGLKSHVIKNHTHMNIPRPVDKLRIDVRQQPGQSYPNPVRNIHITEQNINPGIPNARPHYMKASQPVGPPVGGGYGPGAYCPPQ